MRTGQVSVEFLAVLAIALAIGALLQLSLSQRTEAGRAEDLALDVEELAQRTAQTINLAASSRGFRTALDVPQRISGEPVSITVGDGGVVVTSGSATSHSAVRALAIRNSTSGTPFTLLAGTYYVVNTDGTITIS